MGDFTLVLEILMPALAVGATAFLIIRSYLKYEESRKEIEIEKAKHEVVFPARMQAYERVILLLERVTPESLIRRVLRTNTSARFFQSELITVIRNEYDHNLSQQLYMSLQSWSLVRTSVEETIRMINITASKLPATATATDLAENILHITAQVSKFPTQVALEGIKKEFAEFFLGK